MSFTMEDAKNPNFSEMTARLNKPAGPTPKPEKKVDISKMDKKELLSYMKKNKIELPEDPKELKVSKIRKLINSLTK